MAKFALAVVLSVAAAVCGQVPQAVEDKAGVVRRAQEAEKKGDFLSAYLLYAQVAAQSPKNTLYWAKSVALERKARKVLMASGPAAALAMAGAPATVGAAPAVVTAESGAEFEGAALTPEDLAEAKQLLPPLRLHHKPGRHVFSLKGDSKQIVTQVMAAFGIDTVFDTDYQALQNLRFTLSESDYDETMTALQAATNSFLVPISERMALVARDSAQKRQELEHTMAVSIPMPATVSVQEAQEMARAVQQLFEIQKFGVDGAHRMVVVRDRASKVVPATAVLEQMLRYKAEVMIEVEFMEVNKSRSRDLGIRWQTDTVLTWLGKATMLKPTTPSGFTNFLTFGGGKTLFGIGISSTELLAQMSRREGKTLYQAEMRGSEGVAANFHLGDKYPILTAGYFGNTTGTGTVYRPPPTINFEDLGVVLKITPRVMEKNVVGMEVEAEYKVLTGQPLNGIPVIASRKYTSTVRVDQGEAAIVAGLLRVNEARVLTGVAGLAGIPALGALFRQNSTSVDESEVLLVIRPRLLSIAPHDEPGREFATGSEARPRIPL